MLKKIKISKKGKRATSASDTADTHGTPGTQLQGELAVKVLPKDKVKTLEINTDDYKVSPLEQNEDLSDTSSETNFEEEIRKLIGIRNMTQSPQYSRTPIKQKKQENLVVEFPDTISSRTSFVADNYSLNRGSIPVGNRGSGVSKRN